MAAGKYNILIEQGSTFELLVTLKDDTGTPVDITGGVPSAQIRSSATSPDVIATFTCTLPNPDLGQILMTLSATTTSALNFTKAVYDLELALGSTVSRELEGNVILSKEVTR